jgi:hypothetical protein
MIISKVVAIAWCEKRWIPEIESQLPLAKQVSCFGSVINCGNSKIKDKKSKLRNCRKAAMISLILHFAF